MSKTFCPLPWIHLATRPNGDVRVCCTANASGAGIEDDKTAGLVKKDGVSMNLREHTIEEVWNSEHMRRTRLQMLNDEIPESCRKCFAEESKGIVSKRQWETEVWKQRLDIDSIVEKTDEQGNLPVNVPYFDLRLGNVCQLKCVMCSPHDSSSWIKEWKLNHPKYTNKELINDQSWNEDFDYTWYKKGSFLDSMKDQAQHIKELYFAGGEPLMIPEHYNILQFMVDEGHAENCCIRYNSNGLVLKPELFGITVGKASQISFLLVGIWWMGFGWLSISRLPAGRGVKGAHTKNLITQGYKEIHKVWIELKTLPVLKRFLFSFFFYNMGVQTVMLAATLYGKSELNIPTTNLILAILIIQVVAIPGAHIMAKLASKWGNFNTIMFFDMGFCYFAFLF